MSHDPTPYAAAPQLTEARLGQNCGTWLNKTNRHAYRHFFHIPNGGLRTAREASALKSQHVKPGVSDYLLALPCGIYHGLWMEFKTPTGQLRPEQTEWLELMAEAGYATAVIRTEAEFETVITDYLANAPATTAGLLPCPYCGGQPELDGPDHLPGGSHYYHVACYGEACPLQPETPGKPTAEEAAAAWNTRPAVTAH